jgi:MOSC domain-containing protein YiiM
MQQATHLPMGELEAALDSLRQTPSDGGELKLIVRRPDVGLREVLDEAQLDVDDGLVGDSWGTRAGPAADRTSAQRQRQLTVMNSRVTALVATEDSRWPLAGDQLYVDLDLSLDNLPPGSRLRIGSAVIEVSAIPHTGCQKFVARFGQAAMEFVNSEHGRRLNLRGINSRVVESGTIRVGDVAHKLA